MQEQKAHAYRRMIVGKNVKYRLIEVYRGIALYEEVTPSGYVKSQSWLLVNQHLHIFVQSYNNMCKEELLDSIDMYREQGTFEFKGFMRLSGFTVHPNGEDTL